MKGKTTSTSLDSKFSYLTYLTFLPAKSTSPKEEKSKATKFPINAQSFDVDWRAQEAARREQQNENLSIEVLSRAIDGRRR